MRNFTQFKKGEKETRLDIFCYKLDKKESEELSEILKTVGFTFCYVKSDSILAFLTGNFTRVKRITKNLENYFGFTWTEEPTILGVSKEELDSVLKVGGEDSGSR